MPYSVPPVRSICVLVSTLICLNYQENRNFERAVYPDKLNQHCLLPAILPFDIGHFFGIKL